MNFQVCFFCSVLFLGLFLNMYGTYESVAVIYIIILFLVLSHALINVAQSTAATSPLSCKGTTLPAPWLGDLVSCSSPSHRFKLVFHQKYARHEDEFLGCEGDFFLICETV